MSCAIYSFTSLDKEIKTFPESNFHVNGEVCVDFRQSFKNKAGVKNESTGSLLMVVFI